MNDILENQIDQLFYRLCLLTEEKIKIIENAITDRMLLI